MAKAKTTNLLDLPFKEREVKLTEMVNEAIKACGVGLKPQLAYTKDGVMPVIASIDLTVKEDVKEGNQSAPIRS